MPTYTNTGTEVVTVVQPRGVLVISPGQTIESNIYLSELPTNVTFDSDEPLVSPWVLLDTITSAPSSVITVIQYKNIIINNTSEGTISISANGDTDNALIIMPTSEVNITIKNLIGNIQISDMETSGTVYVYGVI